MAHSVPLTLSSGSWSAKTELASRHQESDVSNSSAVKVGGDSEGSHQFQLQGAGVTNAKLKNNITLLVFYPALLCLLVFTTISGVLLIQGAARRDRAQPDIWG